MPRRIFQSAHRITQKIAILLVLLATVSAHRATAGAQTEPAPVEKNVSVTLSDGVHLSTDLYLPSEDGTFPVLLVRTPYGKNRNRRTARFFAAEGYAVVVQDCRGRGESGGEYYPYFNEGKDGFETQEWAGAQSWSSGVLGTMGASYLGGTQWLAAPHGSRYLKAMAPVATFTSWYGNLYYGGALRIDLIGGWSAMMSAPSREAMRAFDKPRALRHLPVTKMDEVIGWPIPSLRDPISNNHYGSYWEPVNVESKIDQLDLPAFHLVGLYDYFLPETIKSYQLMRRFAKTDHARRNQRLVVGPWDHGTIGRRKVGEVDFGPNAEFQVNRALLRWFDRHLKGEDNGIDREPPIQYFVMGHNDWRHAYEWPPRETRFTDYFLASDGKANTSAGDGRVTTHPSESAALDRFQADPDHPIPGKGGRDVEPTEVAAWVPLDQSRIEQLDDVLVYTSPPLAEDVEVVGPVRAVLYVETDARDTDLVVKLIDVHPDGFAQPVATGIQRGRFRKSLRTSELLTPGEITEWHVAMTHTSNRFLKGHRIRIDISGSCFPLYDRNTNTGGAIDDPTTNVAHQKLHHGPAHPSRVILPISTAH